MATIASPNAPGTLYELACLDEIEGKHNDALRDLQTVYEEAPYNRLSESAHLLRWVIEAGQGKEADATQELSAYLQDDKFHKDEWAKNIGAFLTDQMSEMDLIASADSPNPIKDKLQHCRAWYFVGIKHLVGENKTEAENAFRKCLVTDQKYADYYLLARSQLPQGAAVSAVSSWVDSSQHSLAGITGKYGTISTGVLVLVGVMALLSMVTIAVVVLALSFGPKQSPLTRPLGRVPPMK